MNITLLCEKCDITINKNKNCNTHKKRKHSIPNQEKMPFHVKDVLENLTMLNQTNGL